jgi:hypothetical protein
VADVTRITATILNLRDLPVRIGRKCSQTGLVTRSRIKSCRHHTYVTLAVISLKGGGRLARGSDISKYGGTLVHTACFLDGDGILAWSGTVTIATTDTRANIAE